MLCWAKHSSQSNQREQEHKIHMVLSTTFTEFSNSRVPLHSPRQKIPVVALGGAVGVELAVTDALGTVPAVIAAEDEVGGLVCKHGAVGQRLLAKTSGWGKEDRIEKKNQRVPTIVV